MSFFRTTLHVSILTAVFQNSSDFHVNGALQIFDDDDDDDSVEME